MAKAAVAWLGVADRAPYPVWCLWADDALYVVSGPGEQPAPGLADANRATVTARGDHGGRIVTWHAEVRRITPGSETWDTVAPRLAAKRLNGDPAPRLIERWARECVLSELRPTPQAPDPLPDDSLAAPPPPTPAARTPRPPFRLHRVRR